LQIADCHAKNAHSLIQQYVLLVSEASLSVAKPVIQTLLAIQGRLVHLAQVAITYFLEPATNAMAAKTVQLAI